MKTSSKRIGATGLESAAASVGLGTSAFVGVFIVLPIAVIAALIGAITGPYALQLASSASDATNVQASITVWVNAGSSGLDTNSGMSQSSPVKTLQHAIDVLEKFSAIEGIIELDGTTEHDLGTDAYLNFFPLISRFGNIVIRGQRTVSQTGRIVNTTLSNTSPNARDGFLQLYSEDTIIDVYDTHVVQSINTSKFYVVETNGANTINIVGGDNTFQELGIIWSANDTYDLFQVSTVVTWTGRWTNDASFSKVIFEGIKFVPATNTSQFVAPKYRDDAMIFRGCHFDVKGLASYDFGPASETGLPLELDPRPTVRGSVQLEGCFLNGVNTANEISSASTFTTLELDTKMIFRSVWSNATQVACAGMCVIQGFYGTSNPKIAMLASTGSFFAQGIKFRGTALHSQSLLLRVGTSTNVKIRDLDAVITGGFIIAFMDAHSFGEIAEINVDAPTTFLGVRLGELTQFRVFNMTIIGQNVLSLQFLASVDVYGTLNMTGVSGVPLITSDAQCVIHLNTVSNANHTGNAAPIVQIASGSSLVVGGSVPNWSTDLTFPLIKVTEMSQLSAPALLVNQNPSNPNSTVQCGANPIGPMVTQTDYASNVTQLCVCRAT